MSTVATNNTTSDLYAALNGASSTSKNKSAAVDSQSRFLTLLTAQLKNQDPLNPMDNAQMTSQLAQISTVDGIERLNTTLQSLLADSSNTQALQAASMVGHGVLVPGSSLALQEGNAYAGIDLTSDADSVKIEILDSNGLPIRTLDLGNVKSGSHTFTWDGNTDGGVAAADGSYSFSVKALQGSNKVDSTALSLGLVSSITRSSSGIGINVGQQTFALADIRQII